MVGTLPVVASSYLFDRLVRDRWGAGARWATLWFAAGVVTLLADGQLTFALGVAFGLAALRSLQVGRGAPALRRGGGLPLGQPGRRRPSWPASCSPGPWERGERLSRTALTAGADRLRPHRLVPNLAFPEPGRFPFVASSFVAIPVWCAGALFLTWGLRGEARSCAG